MSAGAAFEPPTTAVFQKLIAGPSRGVTQSLWGPIASIWSGLGLATFSLAVAPREAVYLVCRNRRLSAVFASFWIMFAGTSRGVLRGLWDGTIIFWVGLGLAAPSLAAAPRKVAYLGRRRRAWVPSFPSFQQSFSGTSQGTTRMLWSVTGTIGDALGLPTVNFGVAPREVLILSVEASFFLPPSLGFSASLRAPPKVS